jgi:hypothetical protein
MTYDVTNGVEAASVGLAGFSTLLLLTRFLRSTVITRAAANNTSTVEADVTQEAVVVHITGNWK